MLSLPLLITNLMLTPRLAIASDITLSNGVIFKAKKTRGFTGPEWVLMSGITFEQTDGVAAEFKDWLRQKSTMPDDVKPSEIAKFHSTAIDHVHARALDVLAFLWIITRNYKELKATIWAPKRSRKQRGVMDGGGTALNWLFGMVTTDELDKVKKTI